MDLLFRNFSFAFIRLRQLLGMAAYLSEAGIHADSTTASLYHYFVKIPMHIVKGVRGAMCRPIAKEAIEAGMRATIGYDVAGSIRLCQEAQAWRAIANAYQATHATIHALNAELGAYQVVDRPGARP
jgi:hypothetical protein